MSIRWGAVLVTWLLVAGVMAEADSEEEHFDDSTPDSEIDHDDHELKLDSEESRNLRPRAYTPSAFGGGNNLPSGFRPSPELNLEATLAPRRPQQEQQDYINLVPIRTQQQIYEEQPTRQVPPRIPHRKFQEQRAPPKTQEELEEELEEKEEPDRLSQLLQQSKFNCVGKQTGYYADEELACEVFHYCHDSVKHSWICPNGFVFHQVHLICMPPSGENICERSSKYHFVNEYLYRPINQEEVQRKPNVTLRYSDRYYPTDIYRDDRYEEDEDEEQGPEQVRHRPAPAQLQQQRHQPTPHAQVFRTAEEVNIPLVQRRPHSGFVPTQRAYQPTTPSDFDYQ